jgi:hypothetical protein
MKMKRTRTLLGAAFACVLAFTTTQAGAQTEPLGGQPPLGSKPSVPDLEAQVAYQRAFEAVVWAMPASAIYRFRVGALELPGMADGVVIANPGPLTTNTELITANTVTPYIAEFSDLRKGPVVLELPAKSDKASLYGQIKDIIDVEPVRPRDMVMMGMLATIGIERGKPFNPEGKIKAAMENGV